MTTEREAERALSSVRYYLHAHDTTDNLSNRETYRKIASQWAMIALALRAEEQSNDK